MTAKQWKIAYLVLAFCTSALFAALTSAYVTDRPIIKDAEQNVRSAYHLTHDGMISSDGKQPSMKREPLPIVAIAALLLAHPDFAEPYTEDDLLKGPLNPSIKLINAFWRFLAAFFIFMLCRELFPGVILSAAVALACITAGEILFFSDPVVVDRLYTELPASALLLVASWCAVRFVRRPNLPHALCLGIALGALALTKAAFLYIGAAFIVLLLLMDFIKSFRAPLGSWSNLAGLYAIIVLAMTVTVVPWIVRNYVEFGKPQIARRAEEVLAVRVLLSEQPLLGGLYAFSSGHLRKVVGSVTGYTREDLKPGGRLHELVTAKDRRAEIFAQRMAAEGFQGSRDVWLKQMALKYIAEHPGRYIASIGVFAYKGMRFTHRAGIGFDIVAILCFLGVFVWGLVSGNRMLVAAFGLGFGCYLFMSMFTHVLTRYNSPITPLILVADLWLAIVIAQALQGRPRINNIKKRLSQALYGTDDKRSSQRRPPTETSSSATASRA